MRKAIVTVPGAPIDPAAGLRRQPTRDPSRRELGFDEKFDDTTLFFDVVAEPATGRVRIIAPPLFNLAEAMRDSWFADTRGVPLPYSIANLDRQTQILVDGWNGEEGLTLQGAIGDYALDVSASQASLFAGQRTVLTLSRNNDLVWIRDWLHYYRAVHGATAFLFYDNGSTAYSAERLLEVLESVSGVEVGVVVRWPFKHGPTGAGLRKNWDSNFSQLGAIEHARWRFLSQARSVLSCDIDELVVSAKDCSIFDAVEQSRSGVIRFYGDWVIGIEGETRKPSPAAPMRYRDFRCVTKDIVGVKLGLNPLRRNRCQPKWALVPGRAPAAARWHAHTIEGWWAARVASGEFRFRHFREISNSWKYDRTNREPFDPKRHRIDPLMEAAFRKAGWIDQAAPPKANANRWRRQFPSFSS